MRRHFICRDAAASSAICADARRRRQSDDDENAHDYQSRYVAEAALSPPARDERRHMSFRRRDMPPPLILGLPSNRWRAATLEREEDD